MKLQDTRWYVNSVECCLLSLLLSIAYLSIVAVVIYCLLVAVYVATLLITFLLLSS